jgi:hypothetical protein
VHACQIQSSPHSMSAYSTTGLRVLRRKAVQAAPKTVEISQAPVPPAYSVAGLSVQGSNAPAPLPAPAPPTPLQRLCAWWDAHWTTIVPVCLAMATLALAAVVVAWPEDSLEFQADLQQDQHKRYKLCYDLWEKLADYKKLHGEEKFENFPFNDVFYDHCHGF